MFSSTVFASNKQEEGASLIEPANQLSDIRSDGASAFRLTVGFKAMKRDGSERGFHDRTSSSVPSMAFLEGIPLPKQAASHNERHKQDCAAELHLVVNDSLGLRLAASVNRERQRLAIR